ncbi:hypothetical protein LVY72_08585 [Arthrobacter sp. I2-34]|uniref:Uncharacterized protein n=1 Tax=Arthrobacter hankyongi TaxID=2904801 RepID=A0ABS9L5M1_9MICC|nr:hypothetical protein [Arthrobacter hankyongi]MCG2621972.1 hypothetical protein [Arthrobacter hankyongi]
MQIERQSRKGNTAMTNHTDSASKSDALRQGDHVDIHSNGNFRCSGYVEDLMPQLRIVWIRDLRTGERKMLATDEHCIVRH